jgi:exopolysaccharide biosynthesis polyprenyl glycosylphosphotransferase
MDKTMNEETSTGFLPLAGFASRRREHVQKRGRRVGAWVVGVSFTGDVIATLLGLLLAFWVRFETPMRALGHTALRMELSQYQGHFIFLTVTLSIIFCYSDVYGTGRPQRLRKVNALIITNCLLWWAANLALSFELNTMPIISRIFLCNALVCTIASLGIWRWSLDKFLTFAPVAALLERRILFVGWSDQASTIFNHISVDPKHYYKVVGCVPPPSGDFGQALPGAIRELGDYAELPDILADESIDLAIVANQNPTRAELHDLVTLCEKEIVHLQVIPSCFQVLVSGLHLETTSGVPVLGICRLPLDSPWMQLLKRAIDIIGSLIGLLLSAPVIATFGLLIYLESPGPIFYRQRRGGLGGNLFSIIKLRSMKLNAEASGRPGWTVRKDDRVLRVGAFMRRWNIDEVPQFLNVFLGQMSLVGPRPERPEFIATFKEEIPHYNARHGIKPGITGWAQVNGLRGDTDLTERIRCDLYYMENWSLTLDIQIMLMTFFKRQGAC